ncbi:MAG: di-trans,poly-cis-decaprenylcistransferase, partial [bacterium]|nr:di-trans,poly-cis-decaprenylcistransferase [bacterium]
MKVKNVPKHVAIIMDGNGRWAKKRGLERVKGHLEGMQRVGEVLNVANELGIQFLTLYTFSKQNWKRPKAEISMLMKMICLGLERKQDDLIKKGIRFHFIGETEGVPQDVLDRLTMTKNATSQGKGLQVNMAFNYGSRSEIL